MNAIKKESISGRIANQIETRIIIIKQNKKLQYNFIFIAIKNNDIQSFNSRHTVNLAATSRITSPLNIICLKIHKFIRCDEFSFSFYFFYFLHHIFALAHGIYVAFTFSKSSASMFVECWRSTSVLTTSVCSQNSSCHEYCSNDRRQCARQEKNK